MTGGTPLGDFDETAAASGMVGLELWAAAPEVVFHLYDAASDSLLTTIQDGDRIDRR